MIENLKSGDTVLVVSPAKKIEKKYIDSAVAVLQQWGLNVLVGASAGGQYFYFAGTDTERLADFQWAVNHSTAKAIICARGGYGSVRLVERIDYAALQKYPKWLVGFSDVTVFHNKWALLGLPSIHGTVPLFFAQLGVDSFAMKTLKSALFGERLKWSWPSADENKHGVATAQVVGGNLAIIDSLQGTCLDIDVTDKILFIEDVGEYGYKLDRMLWGLRLSGKLSKLSGMLIGGMTDMKDCEQVMGMNVRQIIAQFKEDVNGPVAFEYPAGHIADNGAIVFGATYTLQVDADQALFFKNS